MESMLKVEKLSKSYPSGDHRLKVLEDISFEVGKGETFAIVGPSGSGKTTLLGLCAGLDEPDQGNITLCGVDLKELSTDALARLRNEKVGFIFQDYQLLPTLTALENVMVPLELRGERKAEAQGRELLERVGLGERLRHYPSQLSGGEQQRVALARAFVTRPSILFADEPTGNLDEQTGEHIVSLLFELNREEQTTLVIVSHDTDLAARCKHILRLKGGKVHHDPIKPVP